MTAPIEKRVRFYTEIKQKVPALEGKLLVNDFPTGCVPEKQVIATLYLKLISSTDRYQVISSIDQIQNAAGNLTLHHRHTLSAGYIPYRHVRTGYNYQGLAIRPKSDLPRRAFACQYAHRLEGKRVIQLHPQLAGSGQVFAIR